MHPDQLGGHAAEQGAAEHPGLEQFAGGLTAAMAALHPAAQGGGGQQQRRGVKGRA
jgi:hypothetical protein